MRTTLDIPEKLLKEARRASGSKNKTQTIILGLQELTRRWKLERLWDLRGKLPSSLNLNKSRKR